jgi:hypothetical protein
VPKPPNEVRQGQDFARALQRDRRTRSAEHYCEYAGDGFEQRTNRDGHNRTFRFCRATTILDRPQIMTLYHAVARNVRRNASARAAKSAKRALTRCHTSFVALFVSDNWCQARPGIRLAQAFSAICAGRARAGFQADTVIADYRPTIGCAKRTLADY